MDWNKTVLICGQSNNFFAIWSLLTKKLLQIDVSPRLDICVGKFYEIEILAERVVSARLVNSCFEVSILHFPSKRSVVVAKAPVFIGNQCSSTKQYIGYSNYFGRIFYDASYTLLKIEQFKTYLCILRFTSKKNRGCNWQVEQILRPDTSLKYYLLDAKVEHHENDFIICAKDNLKIKVRRDDLRQHCCDDLFNLLSMNLIAFRNQPDDPNCEDYICCFATLLDDFSDDLSKNALVPRDTLRCCDDRAQERISVLNDLVHNAEFLEKCLNNNLDLKNRLFNLFSSSAANSIKKKSQVHFWL